MIHSKGFSLVELLVVLLILSMIAVWGMANYEAQVIKVERGQVKTHLVSSIAFLERFYALNASYPSDASSLPDSLTSPKDAPFDFSYELDEDGVVTITATAQDKTAYKEDPCGTLFLTISSSGVVEKKIKDSDADTDMTAETCWE